MNFYIKQCENEHWGPNRPAACYFARRPNGLRKNRTWSCIPTEPFSPNGLIRKRNGFPTFVTIAEAGNPSGLSARRFPYSLQIGCWQTYSTHNRHILPYRGIRRDWQAVRSAGLGSRKGTGDVSQAVRSAGNLDVVSHFEFERAQRTVIVKTTHTYMSTVFQQIYIGWDALSFLG